MTLFDLLKKKILKTPRKKFDRVFWTKFNREFEPRSLWSPFRIAIPATGVGLALLVALWLGFQKMNTAAPTEELITQVEILGDLDLLAAFDDLPLSEDEWEELVSKENHDG